jgi:hypothetical protein
MITEQEINTTGGGGVFPHTCTCGRCKCGNPLAADKYQFLSVFKKRNPLLSPFFDFPAKRMQPYDLAISNVSTYCSHHKNRNGYPSPRPNIQVKEITNTIS